MQKGVEELVKEPPEGADVEVIYFDEKWTCKVKPYRGRSWGPKGEPRKVPAKHEVRGRLEVFASLDVRTGRVRCMRRRRVQEVKRFLAEERHRARAQGGRVGRGAQVSSILSGCRSKHLG